MKRLIILILSLAAIVALASCEPQRDELGRDKRFEYNVEAVLIEKFSDGKFHFVCQELKDGRTFVYDRCNCDESSQKKYDNRKVGDTCFFEFIDKNRFKK
jgi:hypothetical protein